MWSSPSPEEPVPGQPFARWGQQPSSADIDFLVQRVRHHVGFRCIGAGCAGGRIGGQPVLGDLRAAVATRLAGASSLPRDRRS
jgi:hypothetical protein